MLRLMIIKAPGHLAILGIEDDTSQGEGLSSYPTYAAALSTTATANAVASTSLSND